MRIAWGYQRSEIERLLPRRGVPPQCLSDDEVSIAGYAFNRNGHVFIGEEPPFEHVERPEAAVLELEKPAAAFAWQNSPGADKKLFESTGLRYPGTNEHYVVGVGPVGVGLGGVLSHQSPSVGQ